MDRDAHLLHRLHPAELATDTGAGIISDCGIVTGHLLVALGWWHGFLGAVARQSPPGDLSCPP
jgi:hypothetical protein